jgi:hypothetical protein
MQHKNVIKPDGVFIGCKSEEYIKKIQEKSEKLDLFDPDQLTPKVLEHSPYKLHISLTNEEYPAHRDNIKEILLRHLENGVIHDFKFINNEQLKEKVDSAEQLIQLISEYKNMLEKKEAINPTLEKNLFLALDNLFGIERLPNLEEIGLLINRINSYIKNSQRLLEGDQFTIYIPADFDKDMILSLCKEVDEYLMKSNAAPGKVLDVESPIGSYINLRQEYLMEDFNSINDDGFIDMYLRINSAKLDDDEREIDRRSRVVIEQEASDLYKHISNKLTKSPRLSQHTSIFQQPDEKKKGEVAIDQTDKKKPEF